MFSLLYCCMLVQSRQGCPHCFLLRSTLRTRMFSLFYCCMFVQSRLGCSHCFIVACLSNQDKDVLIVLLLHACPIKTRMSSLFYCCMLVQSRQGCPHCFLVAFYSQYQDVLIVFLFSSVLRTRMFSLFSCRVLPSGPGCSHGFFLRATLRQECSHCFLVACYPHDNDGLIVLLLRATLNLPNTAVILSSDT